ncbi:hypothetical protein VP01_1022g4 [Puccinia sorghi]|uniref:Uncharacterized protein n=1 Tax=Puccinia sorghi TaxID=27349 RepID=A0A0L6VUQ5_9BASI|nr:hypothetical protein VP01_1022g4 [Puccinia sorghi]
MGQTQMVYQPHAQYKRVYVTQDFEEWISWFLLLSHVKKLIEDWTEQVRNAPLEPVFDYQQSKFWKKTNPDKVEPNSQGSFLKLILSLYINWFNPFGNKLSGRQASFGVLALTCLDMPPHLCLQTHHLFLAGIIPGPKEPDMIMMSNILKPLFEKFEEV